MEKQKENIDLETETLEGRVDFCNQHSMVVRNMLCKQHKRKYLETPKQRKLSDRLCANTGQV